jgi:FAD/FMN-containing dehydrogenase
MRSDPGKLEALRTQLSGALIVAGHAQYDVSREIWNRCASTDGGVLLDLSGLRPIEINPEQRYAVAQAG